MNLGTNFVLNQSFKSLNKLLAAGKYDEAEAKLEDISNSLSTSDFDPKNKKGTLSLLLNNCLPLTSHENLKIRLHAQNILNHWSSLVTSFLPKVLIDAFANIDASQLKSEAHAAIFTFFTHALRCLQHDNRLEYLGILHSLLLSSKPDLLVGISINIWSLLRETLTISNIISILPVLMNSPLAEEVAFLCEKSPDPLYNTILAKANFEFIKQTLQYWPLTKHVDLSILAPRLITAFESKNSSEISTAIEILTQLVQRVNKLSELDYKEQWGQLITHCQKLWEGSATIAQKAALIDLLSAVSFIPNSHLESLLIFDESIPTPIKISIIKLCSHFIRDGKIPKGLFKFIEDQLAQRDPLIFVAILDFLAISFNDLHKLSPQRTENILNHALTPLSQYFVEQISILHLLQSIDYKTTGVKIDIVSILLNFLNNPHPSLIPELKKTVQDLNINLPLTQLDWIGSGTMILQVISKCDPSFINELIESGIVTPSSYSSAVEIIINNLPTDKTAWIFAQRALYVVGKALSVIGQDYIVKLNNLFSKEWRCITEPIPELVKVINKNLKQTVFGSILLSSLQLFVRGMEYGEYHFQDIETMYSIAIDIAPAFCDEACKIAVFMHHTFRASKDNGDKKKEKRMIELVTKFFFQMLPFDWSKEITEAALNCITRQDVIKYLPNHVIESCLTSPDILQWYLGENPKEMPPISPVFIQIDDKDDKTHNYITRCIKELPFNEWKLTDYSGKKIEKMQGIVVPSYDQLDYQHRKLVDQYPASFVIQQQKKERKDIDFKLDVTLNVQKEFKGEFKGYESQEAILKGETCEFNCSFNPYPHEEKPSLVSLVNFLWFSSRKVTQEDFTTIENSLLPFASRPRVAASFMSYALRHNMPIKASEWASLVRLDARSDSDLIAFGCLTLLGNKDASEPEKLLRKDISQLLGLNYDDATEFAIKACLLDSAKRFAADAILCSERERFADVPSSQIVMKDKETIVEKFDEIMSLFQSPFASSSMLAISSMLFEHQIDSPYVNFDVPPNIPNVGFLYKPRVGVSKPQQDELALNAAEKFVNAFSDENSSDEFLPNIIAASKLSDDQVSKFVQSINRIGKSHRLSCLRIAVNPFEENAEDDLKLLEILPPSYSREVLVNFIRASTLSYANKDHIKKLTKKIKPIFTELLPSGGSKIKRDIGCKRLKAFEEAGAFCDPLIPSMFEFAKEAMQKCETHTLVSIPRILMHTKQELSILFDKSGNKSEISPQTPTKSNDSDKSPSKTEDTSTESPQNSPQKPNQENSEEKIAENEEEKPKEAEINEEQTVNEEVNEETTENKEEIPEEEKIEINSYQEFSKLALSIAVSKYRYMFTVTALVKALREKLTEDELYEAVISKKLYQRRNIAAIYIICILSFPSKKKEFSELVTSSILNEALACENKTQGLNIILQHNIDEEIPEEEEESEEEEKKEETQQPPENTNDETQKIEENDKKEKENSDEDSDIAIKNY
ncbi:hypothetical protein TVAG_225220 [Trichomonas vaginalis G3]|uniref:Uncharacterized protein n=1 Tax=Trichomonas vaginalis (strain ATCC PRA-98 / G3) TaxID=412133 RepID=A2DNQ1_TRIV3|nr:armadillo (ARM) repeat-containing protein family [Trichomonas vaginalis G3]EAY17896.1 hypothetical protein TVAG_225220 [Trichomonas vaginalis G3]KAI5527060.1 armadillo (ARM) repeat-containing protein family [Trichomonas vaginalis G3]|eukprot:XP_001578882.1 hypothetical protein [Trichomonas vaginalis G3]